MSQEPEKGGKREMREGRDYYLNEEGLLTFTADYLLYRGYCCGNGCRHCPYDYEAVPEPRRSELREKNQPRRHEGTKGHEEE